jgi:Zn-dependent peptidase ImmA (M78 family)
MDNDILAKISQEWGVSSETINQYFTFFEETIKPKIKTKYLSHLVATVKDMVNRKRMIKFFKAAENFQGVDREKLRALCASETFRFYSIILEPANLKRRATTRHHTSGAIIYYNSSYERKIIRILIAHEIGHIVNKELLEKAEDSEKTANLFAYVAMEDKNKFYKEECEEFISKSGLQILNDIQYICPI